MQLGSDHSPTRLIIFLKAKLVFKPIMSLKFSVFLTVLGKSIMLERNCFQLKFFISIFHKAFFIRNLEMFS